MRVEMARRFGKVRQRSDSGAWYVDVRPYGRIQWIMVEDVGKKPLDEQLANMLLSWIQAEIAGGKRPQEAVDPYLPRPMATVAERLPDWLKMFRARAEAGERSLGTLREYERYTKPDGHFSPLFGHSIYDLSFANIEDWIELLRHRGIGPKTRKNVVGAFHAFLSWLHKREEIPALPSFPETQSPKPVPRTIPPDAQDAILDAIPAPRRGGFIAAVELLLRPNEVRALNVEDYDRQSRILTIAHAMQGRGHAARRSTTKEGDIRLREVSDRLHEWIVEHLPLLSLHTGERPLFTNPLRRRPGNRWTHWALRKTWKDAAQSAGMPDIGLYEGTKHSTATALRRAGVPLDVIKEAAGHKDVRSTERYAQLADQVVTDALRRRL